MKTLRDAWFITVQDLKNERLFITFSFLFMVYMGGILSFMIRTNSDVDRFFYKSFIDFMFFLLIPMLGFYFSRRSFKYLQEDSYTQMLAYFRSLPISLRVVMYSRVIQSLLAFAMNSVIVFSMIYWLSGLSTQLTIVQYISFTITWIGIGLAITGVYINFEFLYKGKIYLWYTLFIMLVTAVLVAGLHFLGINVMSLVIESAQRWGMLSPLMWGSVVIGLIVLAMLCKTTLNKLERRDLL
ncbi:hypothetical protein PASE110613_16815 [Paenibacillus sediminis]|uniref:Signal transduction histidine kinase n=1 Tax=Paenibacillus sediminis TaxID=664909 RepID=A0ABS4H7W2_9BACL|nr:hypothetical protein [Paenibacillus sediminis]MBP1938561.1 signal transduction histidine kinase [Paenibacillus sediminis]